ncbi:ANTAR domain protein [compost metagenome]|uniref:Histidine kinase n=1 Tax=Paenibacillus stellifer TaxID=169760 RepID=A0A089LVN6_9BACL|nr:ANTAR domain-containing protein [Paenibacillus stellifer]AIQ65596.1 histidine kinase [Paenibacillus stellifer]
MHSLLVVYGGLDGELSPDKTEAGSRPEFILRSCGYIAHVAASREEAVSLLCDADASILYLPVTELGPWSKLIRSRKTAPVLWWCSDLTANLSAEACDDNIMADGILSPHMHPKDIHWSLHFGARQCFERKQWMKEKEQLLSRLEERKWVEMAKGILSKAKNISESEAYDLLRKQAMNERKRMVDVATQIVKVYQMLQDQP